MTQITHVIAHFDDSEGPRLAHMSSEPHIVEGENGPETKFKVWKHDGTTSLLDFTHEKQANSGGTCWNP